MTNAPFDRIEDYQDIQTVNMYHKRVFEMGRNREEVMASIMAKSRDHARTPMQWDGEQECRVYGGRTVARGQSQLQNRQCGRGSG